MMASHGDQDQISLQPWLPKLQNQKHHLFSCFGQMSLFFKFLDRHCDGSSILYFLEGQFTPYCKLIHTESGNIVFSKNEMHSWLVSKSINVMLMFSCSYFWLF